MPEIADLLKQMVAHQQQMAEQQQHTDELLAEFIKNRQTPIKVVFHTGPANELIRAEIVQSSKSIISESISPESTKLHRTLGGINPEIPESIPSVPESRESRVQSPESRDYLMLS